MTNSSDRFQAAVSERYVIEREVGRGGMATVYLARDLKHDRAVALKVLRPELGALLGAERFLREIKLVARLHHPHILPLYDSGAVDGSLYYVMPFVTGESLRDRLRREKQLPLRDALRIAREVADALFYAHGHDIVHRDIKPENILLSGGHAVVADFGIARAIHAAGGEQWETLTESGVSVGTPAYMSPEQATGDTKIDGRSDIYSLACVLFEMLAGEPPFTGPDGAVIIARRFTDSPPNVCDVREGVPVTVHHALSRALAVDPTDRFGNAIEFAEALWATPTTTQTSARHARQAAAPKRHGGLWIGAGGIGAVTALAALWLSGFWGEAGVPPGQARLATPDTAAPRAVPTQPAVTPPDTAQAVIPSAPAVDSAPRIRETRATASRKSPPADAQPVRARPDADRLPVTGAESAAAPSLAAEREDSVWRSVRDAALRARRRAVAAGASASQLATGDSQLTAAQSLAARGQLSEAVGPLLAATSMWADAERATRARESAIGVPESADTQQQRAENPALVSPPPPPPATPRAVEPRAAVAKAIAAYARAIESGSTTAIRRAYPGLTAFQQQRFEEFFSSVTNLRVRLTVQQIDIIGDRAEARIGGSYEYQDRRSREPGSFPVAIEATLERDSTVWRLISVR